MPAKTLVLTTLPDSKIVRIPTTVKDELDAARPAGIEVWRWTADVIRMGLRTMAELQARKEKEGKTLYDVMEQFDTPTVETAKKK